MRRLRGNFLTGNPSKPWLVEAAVRRRTESPGLLSHSQAVARAAPARDTRSELSAAAASGGRAGKPLARRPPADVAGASEEAELRAAGCRDCHALEGRVGERKPVSGAPRRLGVNLSPERVRPGPG